MKRIAQYASAGAVATATHYVVLWALVESHVTGPALGAGIGASVGAVVAYLLNRRAAFASSMASHRTALPRFLTVAACGAALNAAIVGGLQATVGGHYMFAQMTATAVVLAITYGINKAWTFA